MAAGDAAGGSDHDDLQKKLLSSLPIPTSDGEIKPHEIPEIWGELVKIPLTKLNEFYSCEGMNPLVQDLIEAYLLGLILDQEEKIELSDDLRKGIGRLFTYLKEPGGNNLASWLTKEMSLPFKYHPLGAKKLGTRLLELDAKNEL